MVGGEQHGDSESWTGGARYDNRKETSCEQGDLRLWNNEVGLNDAIGVKREDKKN